MQNLCSEKRKNVCKTKYMFEKNIDKQMYVRYNEINKTNVRIKCSIYHKVCFIVMLFSISFIFLFRLSVEIFKIFKTGHRMTVAHNKIKNGKQIEGID
jgi:hypothetical protein